MKIKYINDKKKIFILDEEEYSRLDMQCRTNRAIDDLGHTFENIDESNKFHKQFVIGGLISIFFAIVAVFAVLIAIFCCLWG